MNSLIKTSIKRSVTVCVLVIVLLAVGVLATLDMSTNLLPNIKLPMMGISVVYPGASAQSVEDGVTAKVETALQTVSGLTKLTTNSYDNVSVAVLTFDYGTDIDEKISEIEDAFDSVEFPEGCEAPDYIKIDMNGTATATISLYNAQGNLQQLTDDANALTAKLSGIEGVSSVNLFGTPQKQIRITALSGLDITALLIVQALSEENLDIPLGTVMQDGTTVSIRNASDAASVLDVMRLPVQLSLGSKLFGKLDIAQKMLLGLEQYTQTDFDALVNQLFTLYSVTKMFGAATTDEEVANLVKNYVGSETTKALITPQFIHRVRSGNFYLPADASKAEGASNVSPDCDLGRLIAIKTAHVDNDGNPVYGNGKAVTTNERGERIVNINDSDFLVNNFGRLTDANGELVDDNGEKLELTNEQIAANYNCYGDYVVFDDAETLEICNVFCLGDGMGVNLTSDLVRFVRTCDFGGENVAETTVYPESIVVPLAYIGRVEAYDENVSYAEYNGLLAVTVEVYAVSDANTTDVVDAVKQVLTDTQLDSTVVLLDDKAQFINDSISNVLTSIIIGGVLAVLVIYLFVRKVGSSLVVSVTMPLSVLVALVGLWAMGISLNLVSLGGLAVGIGMLVDNSIVVLESITKRRDMGDSVYDACLNGTREVAGSLFASTLTNVCVFFPILFARGLTREIFYDLVWAVLFSIVMSLIVAITVIPSLYHLIYRNRPRKRREKNAAPNELTDGVQTATDATQIKAPKRGAKRKECGKTIGKMENFYGKVLSKVLTKRIWVCVVALVLFGASIALVFTSGTEFLPGVDKGVIEVDVDFDVSASLDDAQTAGQTIADAIRDHYGDKLQYVSVTVGKQGLLATSNSDVIRIQTDTSKLNTQKTVAEIRELIATLNGLVVKNVTVREMDGVVAEVTGGMSGQSVTLLSDDMETLRSAAAAVREKLISVDPEHIVSAVDNTPALNTEYSFTFDRTKCVERGVDYQTAVMLLRVGLSGYTAANLTVDGENRAVNVQFADASKNSVQAVCEIIVGFDSNGVVKLKDVLKPASSGELYTESVVAAAIQKQDGKYTTSIDVEIYGTDSGSAGKTISKAVGEVLEDFSGVEYLDGGVTSYLNDAFDGLVVSLIAAFVLLYSVMACQFESLSKPFVVIMSIPFSFTGGFLALAITGMTLNVVSFVGLIMLMGVIVNGAIVMIDKINMLIAEGKTPQEAVIEGCKTRLRPILMTTLTTVLALVPLALGLGSGGELMQPMGIVVLGGLLLGTAVTLVLIPCFYCLIKRIRFDKPQIASAQQACDCVAKDAQADFVPNQGEAQNGDISANATDDKPVSEQNEVSVELSLGDTESLADKLTPNETEQSQTAEIAVRKVKRRRNKSGKK